MPFDLVKYRFDIVKYQAVLQSYNPDVVCFKMPGPVNIILLSFVCEMTSTIKFNA